MKISVIMPVYNSEEYLEQAINSLVNQTFKDLEIICVDDGSTDNSLTIINEYKNRDSRIKVITQEHKNAGAARNKGLKLAQGEYVYFLDSDDWAELNLFEETYKISEKYDKPDIIRFKSREFDEETKSFKLPTWGGMKGFPTDTFNKIISLKDIIETNKELPCAPWFGIYRRDFLEKNKIIFDEISTANDVSFFHRCMALAKNIYIIDEFLVNYRRNSKNSISKNRAANFKYEIFVFDELYKIIKDYPQDIKNYFIRMYLIWHILYLYDEYINTEYAGEINNLVRNLLKKYKKDIKNLNLAQFYKIPIFYIKYFPTSISINLTKLRKKKNENIYYNAGL